jgi:hypothetical protein
MELRDAFDQITTIRAQLARTERLRCLRAVPVAFTAVLALFAACAQDVWVPDAIADPTHYLLLWVGSAGIGALAAAIEIVHRIRHGGSRAGAAAAWQALLHFAPSCAAGALVTTFVAVRAPALLWLLPPLWLLLFGLGNLAAARMLPRPASAVGAGYVLAGGLALWLGEAALQPWVMAVPFVVGQASLAAILWWHEERADEVIA